MHRIDLPGRRARRAAWLISIVAVCPAAPVRATDCTSPDPGDWPASRKPYFIIIADTTTTMSQPLSPATSCGYTADRRGHMRCALQTLFNQRAGQANFGLATFAMKQENCTGSCFAGCTYTCFPEESATTGQCVGCGPKPGNAATRTGAFIRVPVPVDMPGPDNLADLAAWVDNNCTNNVELFASGANTPLNGALRDMKRYLQSGWTAPDGSVSYATPLAGDAAETCRSVSVILITDGNETCDTNADTIAAATDLLFNTTVNGVNYPVKTYVIDFVGGSVPPLDQIAAAGGTTQAYLAVNQSQLQAALFQIVDNSTPALRHEVLGNGADENCNSCLNECALLADAGPDRAICANTPTAINGSFTGGFGSFFNYQWSATGGTLTNANQLAATFSAAPGSYQLTLSVQNLSANCTRLDTVTITVAPFPDLNSDGSITTADLQPFVDVLLGFDSDPLHVARSDTNCDGDVDGADIAAFVDALVP